MQKTKEFLGQIKRIESEIESKMADIEHWKSVALSITPQSDGERVQSSSDKQKMANAVIRYVDLERECDALIDSLVDKRQEIISIIEQLDNDLEYNVISKHYVQFKSFVAIAEETHYSYAYILEVHKNGIEKISKLVNIL